MAVAGKLHDTTFGTGPSGAQTAADRSPPPRRWSQILIAYEWLKLRNLDDVDPDGLQFPNFDPSLREAFWREIDHVCRQRDP